MITVDGQLITSGIANQCSVSTPPKSLATTVVSRLSLNRSCIQAEISASHIESLLHTVRILIICEAYWFRTNATPIRDSKPRRDFVIAGVKVGLVRDSSATKKCCFWKIVQQSRIASASGSRTKITFCKLQVAFGCCSLNFQKPLLRPFQLHRSG